MKIFSESGKRLLPVVLLICGTLFSHGCATVAFNTNAPPVLTQDELLRPYTKVGTIEVSRKRWGSSSEVTAEDFRWAKDALRAEAAKIGADAVMLPEVSVELHQFLFFPKSEMKAKGTAIKFR